MKEFKRSVNSYVTSFFFVATLVSSVILAISFETIGELDMSEPLLVITTICVCGLILSMVLIPPDFKYCIKKVDDFIVFEMSEKDHRKINKSFTMDQTKKYVLLDDGISRINIAYNQEVIEFLNEIKNKN